MKGPISLQAIAVGSGGEAHVPAPSQTTLPRQDPMGEAWGGSSLCSHLVAVSLTRTWLRSEEQLNSNSSRKVTWGHMGSWNLPLQVLLCTSFPKLPGPAVSSPCSLKAALSFWAPTHLGSGLKDRVPHTAEPDMRGRGGAFHLHWAVPLRAEEGGGGWS